MNVNIKVMDAKTKFKLKRRYKTLIWLAYSTIIYFVLFLITTIIVRNHSEGDWSSPYIMIPIMAGLILPLFAGLLLGGHAQFTRQQLYQYKRDIRVYRTRKVATAVISLIQQNKIQEAVDLYISYNSYPEGILDDYMYGMLIARCQGSDVEKLQKVGQRKMDEMKEKFSPDKIVF
jgi:hypothetical protein